MLYTNQNYDMYIVAREKKVSGSRIFCMGLNEEVQKTNSVLILIDNRRISNQE